jgi:hypothetical protein
MKKALVVMLSLTLFQLCPFVQLASGASAGWRVAQVERLSPEERERVKKNYEEFKKLSPEEKNRLKQRYQEFKNTPSGEKEKIREKYHQFENMTPEERQNLENNLKK